MHLVLGWTEVKLYQCMAGQEAESLSSDLLVQALCTKEPKWIKVVVVRGVH